MRRLALELEAELVIAGFGKWIKDRPDPPPAKEGESTLVPSLNKALAENAALRSEIAELCVEIREFIDGARTKKAKASP